MRLIELRYGFITGAALVPKQSLGTRGTVTAGRKVTVLVTTKERFGDIEIHEDFEFEQRQWRVQRIGWVVMGLLVVAALLGVFGTGILSRSQLGSGGPLEVEYERFSRLLSPSTLRLRVEAAPGDDQMVEVWLDQRYLERFQIERVTPQPDSVEALSDRLNYSFKVTDSGQPVEISFNLRATEIGLVRGQVGLPEQQPLSFSQFIYP